MKLTSLKALSAGLIAAGLVSLSVIDPAYAASMTSASASSTSTIGTTGTNGSVITVTGTTVSNAVNYNDAAYVDLPTGWTFTSTSGICNAGTVTISGIPNVICSISNTGTPRVKFANTSGGFPAGIPAGTTLTFTFAPGFLNVAAARDFTIGTSGWNATTIADDSAVVTLSGGSTSSPTSTSSASTDPGLAATGSDNTGAIVLGAGFLMAGLVALAGVQVLRRRKNV